MRHKFRPSLEQLPARISLSQTVTIYKFRAPVTGPEPDIEYSAPFQVGPVYIVPLEPPVVA